MKSMTGFGTSHGKKNNVEIEVNIKAVNGRFLETRFHMPKSYAPLEIPLKKKISEMINRGTVDVYINRNIHKNEKSIHISHQEVVAQKWLKAYRKMAKALQLEDDLSLVDVIRLSPDLLKIEASENIEVFEQTLVEQTLVKAVKACVKERAREGK
ncbi:MAG: YicC family protein, partial [Bdellovibrionales bacterium]|nr:YicC family protein [Bdellovibrionales bacterium]